VSHPDTPREPLSDAYLAQCEMDARQFSGAYTGTAGTLAAHVMRLLAELSRVKGKLAVMSTEREQITQQVHLLAAKYESLR
jgi:hypothetical protein